MCLCLRWTELDSTTHTASSKRKCLSCRWVFFSCRLLKFRYSLYVVCTIFPQPAVRLQASAQRWCLKDADVLSATPEKIAAMQRWAANTGKEEQHTAASTEICFSMDPPFILKPVNVLHASGGGGGGVGCWGLRGLQWVILLLFASDRFHPLFQIDFANRHCI